MSCANCGCATGCGCNVLCKQNNGDMRDCAGNPHPTSAAQVPSCDEFNALAAALGGGQRLQDCAGVTLPDMTRVLQCVQLQQFTQVSGAWHFFNGTADTPPPGDCSIQMANTLFVCNAIATAIAGLMGGQSLRDCANVILPNDTRMVTCAQYETDLGLINARLTSLETAVAAINAQISALAAQIAALELTVAGIQAQIADLQASVAQLQTDLANAVAALQADIAALQAQIAALTATINNLCAAVNLLVPGTCP